MLKVDLLFSEPSLILCIGAKNDLQEINEHELQHVLSSYPQCPPGHLDHSKKLLVHQTEEIGGDGCATSNVWRSALNGQYHFLVKAF